LGSELTGGWNDRRKEIFFTKDPAYTGKHPIPAGEIKVGPHRVHIIRGQYISWRKVKQKTEIPIVPQAVKLQGHRAMALMELDRRILEEARNRPPFIQRAMFVFFSASFCMIFYMCLQLVWSIL
jgi:hypothetical protein